MAKPGQSSFRRILLSSILLLSVPVLLMGVYVTYKKAQSSLQETARQNLTESAIRKGESIQESVAALSANMVTASQTVVLQSGSPEAFQKFLGQLAQEFPTQVLCVQLTDLQTLKKTPSIAASTCGNRAISAIDPNEWPRQQNQLLLDRSSVHVKSQRETDRLPAPEGDQKTDQIRSKNQLKLVLSAPVYNSSRQLRYVLSVQSALLQQEQAKPGSLAGSTVVIDEDGTILAHPIPERVGRNINDEVDADRLKSVIKNALDAQNITHKHKFFHLFSFQKNGVELLAGYTSIASPITNQQNRKWIILAITPRGDALADLIGIRQVLFNLTLCLIAANILATLYISRVLARPLEKLTGYARHLQHRQSIERVPHNFKIQEFNQLAEALDSMVERLKAWAQELETAWKEAQAASELKNQFLANISHELRNPLNAIIGCIRLVREDCCDNREEELDFLHRADDAAIHLLGIINDVLDVARIEAGKFSVVLEPVDLRKILKEVINLQAVPIQQKGLKFKTPDLQEPIAVRADPAKLRQVLINVIGNAAKFTEQGSITISIRVEQASHLPGSAQPTHNRLGDQASLEDKVNGNGHMVDRENLPPTTYPLPSEPLAQNTAPLEASVVSSSERVIVTVKDTGIGIDPTQQHKLFRPFVMVDGTTTRKFGGTGLGLALSRNLIELMGGRISLSSDGEGQGTTLEITLPKIEISLLPSVESTQARRIAEVSAASDTSEC